MLLALFVIGMSAFVYATWRIDRAAVMRGARLSRAAEADEPQADAMMCRLR